MESCNDFYNQGYKTSRTLEQYHWLYSQSENDLPPYVIIEEGESIYGIQALIPIKMIDSSGVFETAKSEETFILSDIRGKGFLKKMYDPLFEYAKEKDMKSIWGFTRAVKSLKNAGFETPSKIEYLFLPLNSQSAVHIKNRINSGVINIILPVALNIASFYSKTKIFLRRLKKTNLTLIEIKCPPVESGFLSEKFVKGWGGVTVYRDAKYLQWRIFDNPFTKVYFIGAYMDDQLVGWIAYSTDQEKVGYIIDVFVPPQSGIITSNEIIKELIVYSIFAIRSAGASHIILWHASEHPFAVLVKKIANSLGFLSINIGPTVVMKTIKEDNEKIKDWNSWYVTLINSQGMSG